MSESESNDLIESIEEQTPDDTTPLADDLDASIENLAERIDLSGGGGPMPIGPAQGLAILRPMIRTKATEEPDEVLRVLAIAHLETGALLDKHSDVDPEKLVK